MTNPTPEQIEAVARAIYEAQHLAGPFGDEPIEWGRGGYKTQVIQWQAAARAAISAMPAPVDEELRGLVERLRTHFDDCPPRSGERSFTRELLTPSKG